MKTTKQIAVELKNLLNNIDVHNNITYSGEDKFTADGLYCLAMETGDKDLMFMASCVRGDLNGINGPTWAWDKEEIIDAINEQVNIKETI